MLLCYFVGNNISSTCLYGYSKLSAKFVSEKWMRWWIVFFIKNDKQKLHIFCNFSKSYFVSTMYWLNSPLVHKILSAMYSRLCRCLSCRGIFIRIPSYIGQCIEKCLLWAGVSYITCPLCTGLTVFSNILCGEIFEN